MSDIPRLDYKDRAVYDILYADDVINDPHGILDYLAKHTSSHQAALAYGAVSIEGDMVAGSPGLAWDFVTRTRDTDSDLYERANERFAVQQIPTECVGMDEIWPETFEDMICYFATIIVQLMAEDALHHAVSLLKLAVSTGRLTELPENERT